MGSHFSIVLARNGVTRSVGTFFEHASPLDKLSRYGAACGGPPSLAASRPGYHADFWISGRADFGIIWRTAKRLFSSPDLAWVRPGACLRVAGPSGRTAGMAEYRAYTISSDSTQLAWL